MDPKGRAWWVRSWRFFLALTFRGHYIVLVAFFSFVFVVFLFLLMLLAFGRTQTLEIQPLISCHGTKEGEGSTTVFKTS